MGKYFSIEELCQSNTANARGIDNTPTREVEKNLNLLIENILDPLREQYGKPIYVNSGYRCPSLNKAVGGVSTSQHVTGQAVDIRANPIEENKNLFELIKSMNLPFNQLIWEKGSDQYPDWIHISFVNGNTKRQIIRL